MSVAYTKILSQIAIRAGSAGSLAGSTMTAIEANYLTSPLTATQIDSPAFPLAAMKDALLMAEEKICQTIAAIQNHPLRNYLRGLTANVSSGSAIPTVDSNSNPVIGVIGEVRDGTTGLYCAKKDDPQEVERLVRLISSYPLASTHHYYAIRGATIIHTRTNVKIEVCIYDKADSVTLIGANGNIFLPDALEEMLVCGGIAYLFRGDEAPDTVNQYVQYFQEGLARLEKGEVN